MALMVNKTRFDYNGANISVSWGYVQNDVLKKRQR